MQCSGAANGAANSAFRCKPNVSSKCQFDIMDFYYKWNYVKHIVTFDFQGPDYTCLEHTSFELVCCDWSICCHVHGLNYFNDIPRYSDVTGH